MVANSTPPTPQNPPIQIHPSQVSPIPQRSLASLPEDTMQPQAPEVEVRAGFLGLAPNLQDSSHNRKLKEIEYKRREAAYGAQNVMGLEIGNIHTTREGLTLGKQMLDDAPNEAIVVDPIVDLLNGAARRAVARSENHVTRFDTWLEQRIFGKE